MWVTKLIMNEQVVAVRTFKKVEYIPSKLYQKTKERLEEAIKDTITMYKEIIFGSDIPICMAFLDELRKQQAIDQHVYDEKLMEDTMRKLTLGGLQINIVIDSDMMIDKRTGEVLNPEVYSTYWLSIFTVFIDNKMTRRRLEGLHILNGIDTLDT